MMENPQTGLLEGQTCVATIWTTANVFCRTGSEPEAGVTFMEAWIPNPLSKKDCDHVMCSAAPCSACGLCQTEVWGTGSVQGS